jgi:tRNA-uridine 2-sulfurtransferase
MKTQKHIAIGLSGGVDSSVAAYLLKEQSHRVTAIFMQNWESEQDDPNCTAEQDLSDARAVCDKLDIPLHTVNFSKEYWDNVFSHCLDEFRAGRTPNPDVLCNREIKFKELLNHARSLGADALATGHYAQINQELPLPRLQKACDTNKDQSYFLYMLQAPQLQQALFPLGHIEKPEVRKIAHAQGFITANKKDSTGICFIGERRFKTFLSEYILAQPGNMTTCDGTLIGRHDGLMFYTLGQRKGLNIGGIKNASEEAWYVVDKDIPNNILVVGQGHNHPRLFTTTLKASQLTWVNTPPMAYPFHCYAKTRYRQEDQACVIESINDDQALVHFTEPQRAVTPGQSVVFYDADICLGGGIIL